MPISFIVAVSLLLASSLTTHAADRDDHPTPFVSYIDHENPRRILFVGNSYLYYNDSLHNHVSRMVKETATDSAGEYRYKSATIGGARLAHHSIDSLLEPGRLGIDESFDLVVLQGGSSEPLTEQSRNQMRKSALAMSEEIRATGSEIGFYMTHAYVEPDRRFEPDLIDKIAPAYITLGNELNALVIPVGLAFERAYEQRPDIKLHKEFDGSHPSLLGTYLAACVVYQSIYRISAVDISYDYFGAVDEDDAVFLRRIADETVRTFFARKN